MNDEDDAGVEKAQILTRDEAGECFKPSLSHLYNRIIARGQVSRIKTSGDYDYPI